MIFTINFKYNVEEIINALHDIPTNKEDFILDISADLYGNYLYSFDNNSTYDIYEQHKYVMSIVGQRNLEELWNIYNANKSYIDSKIIKNNQDEEIMLKKLTPKNVLKEKYSFKNYKPNKNSKPVTYNGVKYLSKIQCCILEGITRKELDIYLKEITENVKD